MAPPAYFMNLYSPKLHNRPRTSIQIDLHPGFCYKCKDRTRPEEPHKVFGNMNEVLQFLRPLMHPSAEYDIKGDIYAFSSGEDFEYHMPGGVEENEEEWRMFLQFVNNSFKNLKQSMHEKYEESDSDSDSD